MPKLYIQSLSGGLLVGIWQISETVDDFFSLYPFLAAYRTDMSQCHLCRARACEYVAVRALLHALAPDAGCIHYHPDGAPYLETMQCSISHTRGYAAIALSSSKAVGIDIEYQSERVRKVKEKFIRHDEVAETTASMLIHWSAKEAVYKLFHTEKLDYFDMKIQPFKECNEGDIFVENMKRNVLQKVHYSLNNSYVLTFCSD